MNDSMTIKSVIGVFIICTMVLFLVYYKKKRKEIMVLIISSIIALIIGEFTLRFFLPQIASYGKMIIYDSALGWKFVSNGKGQMVHPGAVANIIETNSLGFRDHAPSDNKKNKLMVLGDSFVSNIAIKEDEVFTEVMEASLRYYDVLNFGVNGYGQVQEYLLLNKWIDMINPDVIIVVICLQNDLADNVGDHWVYPKPYASLQGKDSILTIHAQSTQQGLKGDENPKNLLREFHINRLITRVIDKIFPQSDSSSVAPEFYSCQSPIPQSYRSRFRIMQELLIKIASLGKEKNVPVIFALAPSILQVDDELWKLFLEKNSFTKKNYIRSSPNDWLMQFAKDNNLLMLDLLPVFLEEGKKNVKFYHPVEQHWTKEGNQVVANALMDFLESKSLLE